MSRFKTSLQCAHTECFCCKAIRWGWNEIINGRTIVIKPPWKVEHSCKKAFFVKVAVKWRVLLVSAILLWIRSHVNALSKSGSNPPHPVWGQSCTDEAYSSLHNWFWIKEGNQGRTAQIFGELIPTNKGYSAQKPLMLLRGLLHCLAKIALKHTVLALQWIRRKLTCKSNLITKMQS